MTAPTALYTVTDLAGPFVACRRVVHGQDIVLTAAEAEYEMRAGTIVPSGAPLPTVQIPAPVRVSDVLTIRRADGSVSECTVGDLLALLAGTATPPATFDFTTAANAGHATGI